MQEINRPPTEEELKAAAGSYHALGLSVIPFKLVKKDDGEYSKVILAAGWKKWETQLQTDEEFLAINWKDANAFAVVLGTQARNGLYLSVIDYDCKGTDVTDEVKEKGRTLLKEFPITCTEQTVNNGQHIVYWTRTKPKTIGTYHNNASLELLGEKKLCLMAPSYGYSKLNDNSPTETENIEQTFLSVMKKHGFLKEHKQPKPQPTHNRKSILNTPRPCIIEAQKLQLTGPNGHRMRLAVAAEYKRLGYNNQEIMDLFKNQTDFDFSTCSAQIDSIDAEKTARCESIKEYGYCLPDCELEKPVALSHINEIENPELSGSSVSVQAVVSSTSTSYMIPSEITAVTKEEDQEPEKEQRTLNIDNPINLSLVAIQDETKLNRLKRLFQGKVLSLDIKRYRTVYMVRVRPPVSTLVKQGTKLVDDKGHEYKYIDLYIATDKSLSFQPSELIDVIGLPLPHPRTQKTTLLAYDISFPEKIEQFDSYKLSQLKTKLEGKTPKERLNWILDNCELYTHIVGRRNIAKATLLCAFTPTYVSLFGEVQHGWGLVDVMGDSTVGKSETVKKIVLGLLKAGMYISAETASIVGLVGAAVQGENGGWFIEWGFLPLMDRKILAMDGCHKLSASQWAVTAEAERSGEVTIIKAGKGNAYARTRQIKIYNAVDRETDKYTTKPLAEFLYPIQALATVEDKTSIARRDLAVFADQRDVTPEQINKTPNATYEPELELLAEALKWAWMDNSQIAWAPDAQSYLQEKATELYNKFHYDGIPLVSADMKWKLARLSVSMAYLTLSTDNFTQLLVTKEHVSLVCETLEDEYSRAGLNALAQTAHMERLTPEDVSTLLQSIQGQLSKDPIEIKKLIGILKFILASGGTTKEQIKAKFELTDKSQLRPLIATLQTEGLLKVGHGYYQTAKLVEAYKVTNGFAMIALIDSAEKEHPILDRDKKVKTEGLTFFSGDVKSGNRGKMEPQESTKTLSTGYQSNADEDKGIVKDFEHTDREVNEQLEQEETKHPTIKESQDRIAYFRRLAPNEPHPCDGLDHGRACALLAKYEFGELNFYCENHFQASKRDCESNGYRVTENMQLPDGDGF
jgi:hypothetical protein